MNIIDKLSIFILYVIIALFVSGGLIVRSSFASFEVSQINVFGLVLLLFLLVLNRSKKIENTYFWVQYTKIWRKLTSPERAYKNLLTITIILFVILFMGHIVRHGVFETDMYDMNFQHQPLFYPLYEGKLLHCNTCRMGTLLGEHMVWTYSLIAILAAPFKSDIFLFFIQAFIMAVSVWYFIVKGPLSQYRSLWVPVILLCSLFAPLKNGMVWDFREDVVGCACLLISLTFLWNRKIFTSGFFLLLAMLSKESFPLATLLLGVTIFWDNHFPLSKKQRIAYSLFATVCSVIAFVIYIKVLIPYFAAAGESTHPILLRFPGMGHTVSELIANAFLKPLLFIKLFFGNIISGLSVKYIFMVFLPFIFFARQAKIWLLVPAFFVFMNLIAQNTTQRSGDFHYEFIFLPFLLVAVALGIRRFEMSEQASHQQKAWLWALVLAMCVCGRGPLYEVTERLIREGEKIRPSIQISNWKLPALPIAADEKLLARFNRHPQLRIIWKPGVQPTWQRQSDIQTFLNANSRSAPGSIGVSLHDARLFALRLGQSWDDFLLKEILSAGGVQIKSATYKNGDAYVVLVELPEPITSVWCKNEKLCN